MGNNSNGHIENWKKNEVTANSSRVRGSKKKGKARSKHSKGEPKGPGGRISGNHILLGSMENYVSRSK